MKSIQTKFILLIIVALLTVSFLIGSFSLVSTSRVMKRDSQLMINEVCKGQSNKLNSQLENVEKAVAALKYFGETEIDSLENVSYDQYRLFYVKGMEKLALQLANSTDGVIEVYFRLNPELSDYQSGFFLIKDEADGTFHNAPMTDLSKYTKEDADYVGWYYQPLEAGEPIWMSPYFNHILDSEMISYVAPVYYEDTFIGVVGMDIDFSMFVDMAQEAAVYEKGRANLVDMETGRIFYRESQEKNAPVNRTEITDELYQDLMNNTTNGETLKYYESKGIQYMMAYQTVRNGMKYIMYAPVKEIRQERDNLFRGIIILSLISLLLFGCFMAYLARQLVHPLKELNEAAKQIANGNLDVSLTCNTNDEISTLTASINTMVDHLNEYILEVNHLASQDGLTGVKNKTCYLDYIGKIDSDDSGMWEYAVVLFDVNNLKKLNDQYGHEVGDELIITASQHICKTFSHSPVFRIGGDEFVAILRGEDFTNRNRLINEFEVKMGDKKLTQKPHSSISVAFGMAERTRDRMEYDKVFRLADQRMYEKKRMMKSQG